MKRKHILITLLILSIFIILPYLKYILFAGVIAGILYPVYNKLNKIIKNESISAGSLLILFILMISLTMVHILGTFYSEVLYMLSDYSYEQLRNSPHVRYIEAFLPSFVSYFANIIYSSLPNLSKEIMGYLLSTVLAYYFLIYSSMISDLFHKLGFTDHDREYISNKFYGVVVGNIILWFLQAAMSYIGFMFLGLKFVITLSILVFIFGVLPILGPWTVWAAVVIYEYSQGDLAGVIFSILYGFLVLTVLTEMVIKPLLVGRTANMNPAIALIGLLGGLSIIGFPGIFLGPLILEYTKDFLLKYTRTKQENFPDKK